MAKRFLAAAARPTGSCSVRTDARRSPSALGRFARVAFALLALLGLIVACARAPEDAPDASALGGTSDPASEDEIARLEERIARDRATLARFVTEPRDLDTNPLHTDAALREIADRLTADTRRLDALRAARDGSGTNAR